MKKYRVVIGVLLVIATAFVAAPVFAVDEAKEESTATTTSVGSIQGYAADTSINNGTIVQLDAKNAQKVAPATKTNVQNMFGVTVSKSELLIAPSNDKYQNETYVAVSGTYRTLVSTEGGPISAGDYITISSVDGIGMKADEKAAAVFGRAGASFDGKGVVLGQQKVHDETYDKDHIVQIGAVPVTIKIERNPLIKSTKVDVPNFLERLGQQIAEKKVSPVRIYISLAIAAVSLITAIVVLYAGVRNSVISIGRNPLSKKSVFRALTEIILTSVLVLVIGLFAVYLLLKL